MRYLILWPMLFALAGCSGLSGTDNADPPSELVELEAELRIEELWDKGFEDSDETLLRLAPVISDGILYIAEPSGEVTALDPETGDRHWSVDTDSPLSGGPGVADGLIALGTLEAELILLDTEDGTERWRRRVSSEVLSAPAISGGKVICRTTDGGVTVYSAEDGEKRWVYDRSVPILTLRGDSSPLVHGSQVVAGFAGGKLVGLSLDAGMVNWEATISTPKGRTELERVVDVHADPVLVEGTLYVTAYQGNVAAVSASSGVVLWRREISSHAGLDASWRQVFISDEDDHVWSLDATNGATLWQQKKLHARRLSAPAIVDDMIVVGDFDGYLHWLSQEDGRLLARTRVGSDAIRLKPLVMNDIVFVLDEGGTLSALKAFPIDTESR